MKEKIAIKMAYVGGGASLVLFLVFGLMIGSFIGGVVGLNIAGLLFGKLIAAAGAERVEESSVKTE